MSGYSLRPARVEDFNTIRKIIHQVGINPMGLHWERFILAVDVEGEIIGCGQIKIHGDGSRELASIAVIEAWRNRGVASKIIRRLMEDESGRLFLTCRMGLGSFYQRFDFRQAPPADLPAYFRRLSRLVGLLRALHLMPSEGLLIMVSDTGATHIGSASHLPSGPGA
jgi:N-acetylglutamate synthase-like GNAT family acetyltransferase